MRFCSPADLPRWQRWLLRFCPSRFHYDQELGAWVVCKSWRGKLYAWQLEICRVDGIARLHQDIVQPREQRELLERCYQKSEG